MHDASDRTLGIISINQVLKKLVWEIALVKAIPDTLRLGIDPVDVLHHEDAKLYATINAAATSLALVDWLYHTVRVEKLENQVYEALGAVDLSSDKGLLESLRSLNPAINACHQICNANKHFHLRKPDKRFKAMVFEVLYTDDHGLQEKTVSSQIMWNRDVPEGQGSFIEILEGLVEWWENLLDKINTNRKI